MKVKICGITNVDDAMKAAYYGAWAVGFVFYKKSPRYVSPSRAQRIIEALPPFVTPVGVFVDQSERAVKEICRFTQISTLQFHGDEDASYCARFKGHKVIKAFRVGEKFDFTLIKKYKVSAYLFDAYQEDLKGGTGKAFNWDVLKGLKLDKPYIFSGGLNTENVLEAVNTITPLPYALDVSSGVEQQPGIKNHRAVKTFLDMANFKPIV